MKAYLLMTGSGPIVVLTSHASMLDIAVIAVLSKKASTNLLRTRFRLLWRSSGTACISLS